MDYDSMLERGMKNLPEKRENTERFEIPKAEIMTMGKLTIIKNFSEITGKLRRDEKHMAKYLFKELGIPGSVSGQELKLQGKTNERQVNQRIDEYAAKYVACSSCGKYDTNMTKEGKLYIIKCEVCGNKHSIA